MRPAFAFAFALLCARANAAEPAYAPDAEIAFVRAHAVPVRVGIAPVGELEGAAILAAAEGARVIGLGEITHGAHEPLAARNRWVRYLVEHGAITAVTLESGLAQARRVSDYVLGAPGDPARIVREGLSWGFGAYAANLDLVTWLRRWNDAHPQHTVRIYGADVSGGDTKDGMGGAPLVLAEVNRYLAQADPGQSADVRARLARFAGRFDEHAWHNMSPGDREVLVAAARDALALFDRDRAAMVARSSPEAYAWGRLMAGDIGRLIAMFAVWPVGDPDQLTGTIKAVALRDRAMADYVLWALEREGSRGRLLTFAANGHIARSDMWPEAFRKRSDLPPCMGQHLAATLGRGYRAILTVASRPRNGEPGDPGSIDRLFTSAGSGPFLLAIPAATHTDFWSRSQSLTQGLRGIVTLVPRNAADAFLFVGALTDEPGALPHP